MVQRQVQAVYGLVVGGFRCMEKCVDTALMVVIGRDPFFKAVNETA